MSGLQVAALGCFIQAAAHYIVAGGGSGMYALWCGTGGIMAAISTYQSRQ